MQNHSGVILNQNVKENGHLHSDSRRKAEILGNQFCSVLSKIPIFKITVQGVIKWSCYLGNSESNMR